MKSNWILGITFPVVIVGVFLVSAALRSDPQPATAAGTPVQDKDRPAGVITIGSISNEPGSEIEVFQPFADYLAGQLTDSGIGRGKVVVARDIEGMAKLMGRVKLICTLTARFRCSRCSSYRVFASWQGAGRKV